MRAIYFAVLSLALLLGGTAFGTEKASINWISLEEAQAMNKENPRKILIDVYTSWCGPCKMMMASTFTDPEVIKIINEKYYAVKFNAEGNEVINFKGETFTNTEYDPERKGRNATHPFAGIAQTNGRLAYPTIVYLDHELNKITAISGFIKAPQMMPVLEFISAEAYKTETFEQFKQKRAAQKPAQTSSTGEQSKAGSGTGSIEWMSWNEAMAAMEQEPKNIFVDVYTDWCGWCKRMDATTFKNKKVAEYMNKYYYAVKMDAEMKETIVFQGHTFENPDPEKKRSTHTLASSLLDNKLSYPSFVILNEQYQRVQAIPGYQKAADMTTILAYLGDAENRKVPYEEFVKTFNSAEAKP